jgi:hypothetical protein
VPWCRQGHSRFQPCRIGVDIPDADAARLDTLDKLIEYCAAKPAA